MYKRTNITKSRDFFKKAVTNIRRITLTKQKLLLGAKKKNGGVYLNFANSYRDQVLYDLNRGNTSDYYINDSSTPTPGKKYKSKSSKQFIILANVGRQDI